MLGGNSVTLDKNYMILESYDKEAMMPTKLEEIVEVIINDWNGAGYIKDPDILTNFLEEKSRPLVEGETNAQVAKLILDDFHGPGRYIKPKDLAVFLKRKIELR